MNIFNDDCYTEMNIFEKLRNSQLMYKKNIFNNDFHSKMNIFKQNSC